MKDGQAYDRGQLFLPDLCNVRSIFVVVVVTQLLAFVLSLAGPMPAPDPWLRLALISLFMQWIGLTSIAALCALRPLLRRFSVTGAVISSFLVLLLVCLLLSEVAYWLTSDSIITTSVGERLGHAGFVFRNLAVMAIVGALALRYLYVQHQWRLNVEGEAELRIQALQARMRPHFLFNSMNTIAALIRGQPETAEEAIEDLADLFRISLSEARTQVRLAEEVNICRQYVRIESLRLGDRLRVCWKLDEVPSDALVPTLCVQPLLENAIYHGIEGLAQGGTITIAGEIQSDMITLSVENPLPKRRPAHRRGNQMALENTRQRLHLAYGERASLGQEETKESYRVWLRFPYLPATPSATSTG